MSEFLAACWPIFIFWAILTAPFLYAGFMAVVEAVLTLVRAGGRASSRTASSLVRAERSLAEPDPGTITAELGR